MVLPIHSSPEGIVEMVFLDDRESVANVVHGGHFNGEQFVDVEDVARIGDVFEIVLNATADEHPLFVHHCHT